MRLDNGCVGRAQFMRSVGGGGRGEGGGFCQITHSSYSRRQIPSDTPNCLFPKNSFLPRTFHYFHISQPAKSCQKNRYFEQQIHWVPLFKGFSIIFSKSLVAIYRFTNVRIFLIPFSIVFLNPKILGFLILFYFIFF